MRKYRDAPEACLYYIEVQGTSKNFEEHSISWGIREAQECSVIDYENLRGARGIIQDSGTSPRSPAGWNIIVQWTL